MGDRPKPINNPNIEGGEGVVVVVVLETDKTYPIHNSNARWGGGSGA